MKKLLIIAVLILCLTALVSVGASGGGGNTEGPAPDAATYQYLLAPGEYVVGEYSDLYAHWWEGDLDLFVIVNVGTVPGGLVIDIEDCCILLDSMVALVVTSDGIVGGGGHGPGGSMHIGPIQMPPYSWAIGIAGYWWCPGGFPAGYYYDIYMKAPSP